MLESKNTGALITRRDRSGDRYMITVTILRGCYINGVARQPGETLDVSESDAGMLVGFRKAEVVKRFKPEISEPIVGRIAAVIENARMSGPSKASKPKPDSDI